MTTPKDCALVAHLVSASQVKPNWIHHCHPDSNPALNQPFMKGRGDVGTTTSPRRRFDWWPNVADVGPTSSQRLGDVGPTFSQRWGDVGPTFGRRWANVFLPTTLFHISLMGLLNLVHYCPSHVGRYFHLSPGEIPEPARKQPS